MHENANKMRKKNYLEILKKKILYFNSEVRYICVGLHGHRNDSFMKNSFISQSFKTDSVLALVFCTFPHMHRLVFGGCDLAFSSNSMQPVRKKERRK